MSAVVPGYHGGDCGGDPPERGWQASSGCQASGAGKAKRSKNKNINLKELLAQNSGKPLDIDFEKGAKGTYIAVGPNSSHFNSLVGTLVSKIPYHYDTWRNVPPEETCTIIPELQGFFDLRRHLRGPEGDLLRRRLDNYFATIYKNQKYKFGKKFFEDKGGVAAASTLRRTPPAEYEDHLWQKFVDYRCSDKFQKRSSANKGCRAKQEIVVRHGRKNLAQVRFENRPISPIDLYARMRSVNGVIEDPRVAANHAQMVQMRDNPNNNLTEEEIMAEVLGERRGWNRGIGQKLSQSAYTNVSSSSSAQRFTEEDVRRMMAQYTAPIWNKLGMTPPPFHVDGQKDAGGDDAGDDDAGDDDGEDDDGEDDAGDDEDDY